MRRTVGLAIGLCATLLTATGAATATELRERPTAVGSRVTGGPQHAGPQHAGPAPAGADTGAQTIGTVEHVAAGVLGYLGARRRMELHYPGAAYVKVHFTRLTLLPGDRVVVSDPQGRERTTYHSEAEPAGGGQWAMSVSGDTAVVELESARTGLLGLGSTLSQLGVTVDRVARGFTPAERSARSRNAMPAGGERTGLPSGGERTGLPSGGERTGLPSGGERTGREESVCGRSDEKADAVCYRSAEPIAYQRSKAVARLLIDGVELCTGWRVGPNNRMLTNNHCFDNSDVARNTEVWFNYECAECGGWEVMRTTKVWGAHVLASDARLDYTLFTVDDFRTVERFGNLELDVRQPDRGEEMLIPQYPHGDPMVIAMADPGEAGGICAVDNPAYDGYGVDTDISYYCDTDGGSSGSPVISRATYKVIGLHHFGGCPNSGVRIDRIYAQIGGML